MKNVFYLIFIIVIIFSCKHKNTEHIAADANDTSDTAAKKSEPLVIDPSEKDSSTVVNFDHIKLIFHEFIHYETVMSEDGDTCYIGAEIGETAEGREISMVENRLENITIEQRYVTSISVSMEGPHCDFRGWNSYISDWALLSGKGNIYKAITYTEEQRQKFPETDLNDLKQKVKIRCGEEWYELIKNIKYAAEYPLEVMVSAIHFRITGTLDGKKITKIIIIEESMGC